MNYSFSSCWASSCTTKMAFKVEKMVARGQTRQGTSGARQHPGVSAGGPPTILLGRRFPWLTRGAREKEADDAAP